MEGLPIVQEVFTFLDDTKFKYEKRKGFEGQRPREMSILLEFTGTYKMKGNVVTLNWPKDATKELRNKYPTVKSNNGMLMCTTDGAIIFV